MSSLYPLAYAPGSLELYPPSGPGSSPPGVSWSEPCSLGAGRANYIAYALVSLAPMAGRLAPPLGEGLPFSGTRAIDVGTNSISTGSSSLLTGGCRSNFMEFLLNFSVWTSFLAYISTLSWNFMPRNYTGGAPFSKAGVRSTSLGMIPLFKRLIIPLLMSSSDIGGGFYISSYSSRNFLCRTSLSCLALITPPSDFLAL